MDTIIHTFVGIALIAAGMFAPLGLGVVFLNAVVWFAREAEQAEAKEPGARWRPWRWSAHRHVEWAVPAGVGLVAYVAFALLSIGAGFGR